MFVAKYVDEHFSSIIKGIQVVSLFYFITKTERNEGK